MVWWIQTNILPGGKVFNIDKSRPPELTAEYAEFSKPFNWSGSWDRRPPYLWFLFGMCDRQIPILCSLHFSIFWERYIPRIIDRFIWDFCAILVMHRHISPCYTALCRDAQKKPLICLQKPSSWLPLLPTYLCLNQSGYGWPLESHIFLHFVSCLKSISHPHGSPLYNHWSWEQSCCDYIYAKLLWSFHLIVFWMSVKLKLDAQLKWES